MHRRSLLARPRLLAGAVGIRLCVTAVPSSTGPDDLDVAAHYTASFRSSFKRCESDHEALADVIAAAKDQRGAPPITTMGSVAAGLNAAANMAMKDPDAFAAAASTGLSMVNFAAAVEADEVSDLSQAPPPPTTASVTTLPKPPKAEKTAAAVPDVASASVVYTCSMCERRFRLQQSAEMHNQTRHNGQATVQMVDLTKEAGAGGVTVGGGGAGAGAAAASVRGRRVPDVPVPQARRLAAEEVEAFARAAPAFRKPRSKLGARIPTLLDEFDGSADVAKASASNDDAEGSGAVPMGKAFAAQESTVPDEVQLHASASLVSTATFIGRVVAVEADERVAPLQFAEPQPVVTVVLAVASEPLTGSDAFAEPLLEGDALASSPPEAEERIQVVMPASQVPHSISVGKTMHVTGRLRCQQVWSTDLGRHVPAAYVVPRVARVF